MDGNKGHRGGDADRLSSPLAAERTAAGFSVRSMSHLLYGGKQAFDKRQQLYAQIESDPMFRRDDVFFLNHGELYRRSVARGKHFLKRCSDLGITPGDADFYTALGAVNELSPIFMTHLTFLPILKTLCSPEQAKEWIPRALKFEILGCYAQTELGHGSNIRGLETTATFIKESDEFELHSPTLTSTKWWIGGLGKTATHAVVFARLILSSRDLGVHAFIVQIRDMNTHLPLAGITVGDIGPKLGFNHMDNGFVRFDRVRIPRSRLLAGAATVTASGEYKKVGNEKLTYGGMVALRAHMVAGSSQELARAVTIAVRYSAVRAQSGLTDGWISGPETPVLNYKTQQYRILPQLAIAYAVHFTGRQIRSMFEAFMAQIAAGDSAAVDAALPELHATTAGLKSFCTGVTADGMEECRRACGGHGYSAFAGIGERWATVVHMVTAEGENYLLTQQTARYLLKALELAQMGKRLSGNAKYLENSQRLLSQRCAATSADDFSRSEIQLHAFRRRATRLLVTVALQLQQDLQNPKPTSPHQAWNDALIELARVSHAHSQLVLVSNFINALDEIRSQQSELYQPLKALSDLFALYLIEKELGDFCEDGYITVQQSGMVRQQVRHLLSIVRRGAVSLVDAFAFSDVNLNSALGRYDGQVYEALYAMAQREPLNAKPVFDGYAELLQPLLKANL